MGHPYAQDRRRTGRLGRAAVTVCAAVAAVLAPAAPALADVAVTPAEAVQGDAARITFLVTNPGPRAAITRIEVRLPADTPIAEVYPLSVANWAPAMKTRTLATALPGVHGTGQTEVTTAVTWVAVGKGLPPGGSAELSLEMGPMPSADRLAFQVVQTDSDGGALRYTAAGATPDAAVRPALVVSLRPPVPGQAPAHAAENHGGAAAGPSPAAAGAPADGTGPGRSHAWWLAGAMLLIGVIAGAGMARQRRPGGTGSGPPEDEKTAVPVGSNSGAGSPETR